MVINKIHSEVKIQKTITVDSKLNIKSTFKTLEGKEVTGKSFIGKPKFTVDVLNSNYNTDMFIISSKHEGKVLIEGGGKNGETLAYPVSTTKEVEELLKMITDLNRRNTDYNPAKKKK